MSKIEPITSGSRILSREATPILKNLNEIQPSRGDIAKPRFVQDKVSVSEDAAKKQQ